MTNLHDSSAADEGASPRSGESQIGEAGREAGLAMRKAGKHARKAASSIVADANAQVAGLLDQQVEAGADLVSAVASSLKAAADNLEDNAPQLSGLALAAADRVEEFSDTIRDQTAGDLFRAGSDFARRRPAVVFGAAAVLGFLLYRVVNAPGEGRAAADRQREGRKVARRRPARKNAPRRRTEHDDDA
jgi:hypothetical protein